MKTRGVDIVEGWIVVGYGRSVPDCLWARLKHAIDRERLREEYLADYAATRSATLSSMPSFPSEAYLHTAKAEERLFRRWAERACGPQTIWPWERGWTGDLVDSYLTAPAAREAA